MKITFRIIGMMLCVILMGVGFNSCGSDGDEDSDKNPSIVGTWYTEDSYSGNKEYAEWTYKKDGTVTGYWKFTYKDGTEKIETDTGRYEVIKDVLRIWWASNMEGNLTDGPYTVTFSINGNKMTTSEDDGTVWTRK